MTGTGHINQLQEKSYDLGLLGQSMITIICSVGGHLALVFGMKHDKHNQLYEKRYGLGLLVRSMICVISSAGAPMAWVCWDRA